MVQILMQTYMTIYVYAEDLWKPDCPLGLHFDLDCLYTQPIPIPEPQVAPSSDIPHPLGSVDPQESIVAPRGCGDLRG